MNTTTNVMVDIETQDTDASAVILSIGARVLYSESQPEHKPTDFYSAVAAHSQPERTTRSSTLKWWSEQPRATWEEAHSGTQHIATVLRDFVTFCGQFPKNTLFWCKGVTFDFPILEHAMKEHNILVPWKYYQLMDCRTVFNMFKDLVPKVDNPQAHNAHADACCQAKQLEECLNILNMLRPNIPLKSVDWETVPLGTTVHAADLSWKAQFDMLKRDNELLAKKIASDADKFTAIRNALSGVM